jgi:hypothetical protein
MGWLCLVVTLWIGFSHIGDILKEIRDEIKRRTF